MSIDPFAKNEFRQEHFGTVFHFPAPEQETPEAPKAPQIFESGWRTTSFMVLLILLIIGGSLTFVVYLQAGLYTDNSLLIKAIVGLFVVLFLWMTEGCWFALTCHRFAEVNNAQLVLYGAFGRKRLRCRLDDARFYYGEYKEGGRSTLSVEYADGRIRNFSLGLCKDPDALTDALAALNRLEQERQLIEAEADKLLSDEQKQLRKAYVWLFFSLIPAIGIFQMVFYVFWSIHLLPDAWQWGAIAGVIAVFPVSALFPLLSVLQFACPPLLAKELVGQCGCRASVLPEVHGRHAGYWLRVQRFCSLQHWLDQFI